MYPPPPGQMPPGQYPACQYPQAVPGAYPPGSYPPAPYPPTGPAPGPGYPPNPGEDVSDFMYVGPGLNTLIVLEIAAPLVRSDSAVLLDDVTPHTLV